MRGIRRVLTPAGCALVIAALAAAASGCGSSDDESTTATTTTSAQKPNHGGGLGGPGAPPIKRTGNPRKHHKGPPGRPLKNTYAGRIVGHELAVSGPIQPDELWPVTNAWRISDHRNFTAVYAGANPRNKDDGRLVVFRQDFVHVRQTARDVDVKGSGPVTIVAAPEGRSGATAAQRDGELRFRGESGVTGTLDLRDDTVTVAGG